MKKALEEQVAFESSSLGRGQGTPVIRPTQLVVIIYILPQASSEEELLMRGHSGIQSEFSNYNNSLEG